MPEVCEAHINDAIRKCSDVKKISSSHKKGETTAISESPFDYEKKSLFTCSEENKVQLYLKQKALLDQFLQTGAISKAQYDKSLGDLTEKMGMQNYAGE